MCLEECIILPWICQTGTSQQHCQTWHMMQPCTTNCTLLKLILFIVCLQATTLGGALNDIGSWALIAWHATFYERVFDLTPEVYAPLLAAVIPIGGIIGGVGGGLIADRLSQNGQRFWLTFGATALAAPFLLWSFDASEYGHSFFYLLFGFALSEAWRAPAAVMVREAAPPDLASSATAANLCLRNLVAGLGPLAVALLSDKCDLQVAMRIIPVSYLLSGTVFLVAEYLIHREQEGKSGSDDGVS